MAKRRYVTQDASRHRLGPFHWFVIDTIARQGGGETFCMCADRTDARKVARLLNYEEARR